MPALVYRRRLLPQFSLINAPWGWEFSGSLGSGTQCSHCKGSGPIPGQGTKTPQAICCGIKGIKTNIPCTSSKELAHQCRRCNRHGFHPWVWVWSPDALEEGIAALSRILAWRIPRTQEPGRPQSMGSQRVRHS